MREIKIILKNGKEIIDQIPQKYIDEGLTLYWVDVICKKDVRGWIDYKITK